MNGHDYEAILDYSLLLFLVFSVLYFLFIKVDNIDTLEWLDYSVRTIRLLRVAPTFLCRNFFPRLASLASLHQNR